jgi:hypothetical protein
VSSISQAKKKIIKAAGTNQDPTEKEIKKMVSSFSGSFLYL